MSFNFFNGFGISSFTSAPSSAEEIYNTMRAAQGGESGIYRNNGYADSEIACIALQLASIYEDSNRAIEQLNPDFVTILLECMEEQAGIVKDTSRTLSQRRQYLKAVLSKVPALQDNLVLDYLRLYVPTGIVSVSFPKLTGYPTVPPTNSYFTFSPNPTPSYIRLLTSIPGGNNNTVDVNLITGEFPKTSFIYCFLQNMWSDVTQVTVNSATRNTSIDNNIGKGFTLNVNSSVPIYMGECGSTFSCPLWPTGNRRVRVAVTQSLSEDASNMHLLRGALERILSVGTVYEFVRTPQDTTFTLDQDRLDVDRILLFRFYVFIFQCILTFYMANFTTVRPSAIWASNSTLLASELAAFDSVRPKLINASDGSVHAPTSEIQITDANSQGFRAWILKGGNNGVNESFKVQGTTITVDSSMDWNGSVAFNDPITISTLATATASLQGTTTNTGTFVNSGAGKITSAGNKIELTDGTYIQRTTAGLTGNHQIPFGLLTTRSATLAALGIGMSASSVPGSFSFTAASPASNQYFDVVLLLDPNLEYSSFSVTLSGGPGTHTALPANMPVFELYRVTSLLVTTLLASATSTALNVATYEAGIDTVLTPTAFVPDKQSKYVLRCYNEHGANAKTDLTIFNVAASGTLKTYGRSHSA